MAGFTMALESKDEEGIGETAQWIGTLAVQTQRPEFRSRFPHKMLGVVTGTLVTSVLSWVGRKGLQKQEDCWDLLAACLAKKQQAPGSVRERPCLKGMCRTLDIPPTL